MTLIETPIILATNRERPTHGYETGQLLLDILDFSMHQLVARNPHVWRPTLHKNPITRKYGRYEANSMQCRGEGMMADVAPLGSTFTGNGMDGSGTSHNMNTGATQQNAGIVILRPVGSFAGLTRPAFSPYYYIKNFVTRPANDARYYSGWLTTPTPFVVGEDPILQADGGLVVGYNAADSKWNVWHGDGVAAISKVPLVPDVIPATAGADFRVEIKYTSATNAIVTVSNSSDIPLGSATITSNLPASTKTLNWGNCVQNINATAKSITIYGAYMESQR